MKHYFKQCLSVLLVVFLILFHSIPGNTATQKVRLNKESVTLQVGKTTKLKLIGTSKTPKWKSSKQSVVKVNTSGKVTAVSKGTAKITAKLGKKTYTCLVTVQSSSSNEYRMNSSMGEQISVKPGFSRVLFYRQVTRNATGTNTTIQLPSIEGFEGSKFLLRSDKKDSIDDYYTATFRTLSYDTAEFLEEYAATLEEYGFKLADSFSSGGNQAFYFLYEGTETLTNGLIESVGVAYDFKIFVSSDSGKSTISIDHPAEVGFVNVHGDQIDDYSSKEVATDRSIDSSGNTVYKIAGWGESGDYVRLTFNPERYKKGDTIQYSDFIEQENAGSSALCSMVGYNNLISGDPIWDNFDVSILSDAKVKIVKQTTDYEVIYFYFAMGDKTAAYILEGLCSAKLSDKADTSGNSQSSSSSGTGKISIPTGKTKCTHCDGGYTKCHTCGGDGFVQCPNCRGTGKVKEFDPSNLSIWVVCKRCEGKTEIKCTNSLCSNGKVKCSYCNGTGYR